MNHHDRLWQDSALSELGWVLAARTEQGVCAILLGDSPDQLLDELRSRFKQAEILGGDAQLPEILAKIIGFIANPALGLDLRLDARGTDFQQLVWQALRQIRYAEQISYAELANRISQPTAVRAVARACGANPVALAIPCHRVVASNGKLSGYRWGVERKAELLRRESLPKPH
ncbi:methylated-DNA--[protein]-cysteine S-methyltransferase [Methylomonas paludis]|uniref:methylated-DNA--[protein]-cysteine S-methyltransferase n=1 Tax=Methylomonas paludis TaxID=1173101 RepID=A0A975R8H5_9GAMM|nr:methylated-DNA--[protein]-cysteine S-methyltransferase [Methylomonas paludis]QWF70400.1 methylated-DNA--[protein]-cysteine S-methyltransferase [Methylomonas paludis]